MATITEQKAELTILHKSGVIAEATYINLMSALNAETMLWICRNADAIQDYMKQDHLTMRRASQTLISHGALTQSELFGETVEA